MNCLDCSLPTTPELLNGKKLKCEILEDPDGNLKEWTTFECNLGYEMGPHIHRMTVETEDGQIIEDLRCNRM